MASVPQDADAQADSATSGAPRHGAAAPRGQDGVWYCVLREGAVLGKGERLGRVGGRIVAEVLAGLLAGDPQSYLRRKPAWTPILPAAKSGDFTMADLVKFALG